MQENRRFIKNFVTLYKKVGNYVNQLETFYRENKMGKFGFKFLGKSKLKKNF